MRGPDPRISNRPGGLLPAPPLPLNEGIGRARPPDGGLRRPNVLREPDPRLSNNPYNVFPARPLPANVGINPAVPPENGPRCRDVLRNPDPRLSNAPGGLPDDINMGMIDDVENGQNDELSSDHESDEDVLDDMGDVTIRADRGEKRDKRRRKKRKRNNSNDNGNDNSNDNGNDNSNDNSMVDSDGEVYDDIHNNSNKRRRLRLEGKIIGAGKDMFTYGHLSPKEKKEWKKFTTPKQKKEYLKSVQLRKEGENLTNRIDISSMRIGNSDAFMG